MGAPHDPERIGEEWGPERLQAIEVEIEAVRELVVLSGGWAWHYMTPPGHRELKHAHDHKDADLFVLPERFSELVALLKTRAFERTWTRFDGQEGSESFYRYTKTVETKGAPAKVMFDVFVEEVPWVQAGPVRVVEPAFLTTLYGHKHSSDQCFSLRIARRLLAEGISPVGRAEMADYSEFL